MILFFENRLEKEHIQNSDSFVERHILPFAEESEKIGISSMKTTGDCSDSSENSSSLIENLLKPEVKMMDFHQKRRSIHEIKKEITDFSKALKNPKKNEEFL